MRWTFFFLILCTWYVRVCAADMEWSLGKQKLDLVVPTGESFWVSSSCLPKKDCQAWKATQNKATGVKSGPGGTNPGSLACRQKFRATVILAEAEDGGTQGFCVFKDKSMVSLNGIW